MKKLITLLTITLLISACGTGSNPDESPYPVKMGAFMTNSANQSDYIGVSSVQSKVATVSGDTLTISGPDDFSMEIYQLEGRSYEEQFTMRFVDSTLSEKILDSLDFDGTSIELPGRDTVFEPFPLDNLGGGVSQTTEYAGFRIVFYPNCDRSVIEGIDDVQLNLLNSNDQQIRSYVILMPGFVDTIMHVACGEPI